jgi:hypothetical protein
MLEWMDLFGERCGDNECARIRDGDGEGEVGGEDCADSMSGVRSDIMR